MGDFPILSLEICTPVTLYYSISHIVPSRRVTGVVLVPPSYILAMAILAIAILAMAILAIAILAMVILAMAILAKAILAILVWKYARKNAAVPALLGRLNKNPPPTQGATGASGV